jgi:hypothetical protein
VVSWEQGTNLTFQPFNGPPEGFETEAAAEAWRMALGEKWLETESAQLDRTISTPRNMPARDRYREAEKKRFGDIERAAMAKSQKASDLPSVAPGKPYRLSPD